MQYPARGAPALAEQIAGLLQSDGFVLDRRRGQDHGTWSVPLHVYPEADVAVVQLSIDRSQTVRWHHALEKEFRPLRDEGVLILGRGNLVHNLHTHAWGTKHVAAFDWALRFETLARDHLAREDSVPLVEVEQTGPDAQLAVPTPDHYLPLLYVLVQHREGDEISFPVEGFDRGSMSMLGLQIG